MNMNEVVGRDDLLMITLDTLRYDVAQDTWHKDRSPNLASRLPATGWEMRHTPGSFTYAAHAAFFAGFLPTPAQPGKHGRLFAMRFPGSETTTRDTCVLDGDNLAEGLAARGYHTICIGGVGFFNKQSPLGHVFPSLFMESYWSPELGVTHRHSTRNQVRLAVEILDALPRDLRVFLFINVSAVHQPNYFYLHGACEDSIHSHRSALEYVDSELPPLFAALERRGSGFGILCSDHGTAYGEDGYVGHRLAHAV
ncbi:MAG TPA: STM4013/SEN3800 family hydrolase, partial [Gemmataceae bacterium]|nr:STM4013/SEN3800 family hydrolase [Gemmataceae bacterium]